MFFGDAFIPGTYTCVTVGNSLSFQSRVVIFHVKFFHRIVSYFDNIGVGCI